MRRRELERAQGDRDPAEQRPDDLHRSQAVQGVPPLVTDIELSLDDKFLYVSCWGRASSGSMTSATRQPRSRQRRLGGIVARSPHQKAAAQRRTADVE